MTQTLLQVPLLGALTEEQLAAMLAAQPQTEEASLLQWARSQGVEPPPPPNNVTEALAGAELLWVLVGNLVWGREASNRTHRGVAACRNLGVGMGYRWGGTRH